MNTIGGKQGFLVFLLGVLLAAGIIAGPAVAHSLAPSLEGPTMIWSVNNTGDSSGACTPESCSLREAIIAANANTGPDLITFNIPVTDTGFIPADGYWLITLSSALPVLSDGFTALDAHTQPSPLDPMPAPQSLTDISSCGPTRIQINAAAANYGFEVTATDIEITGFKVYGAQANGIYIHGANAQNARIGCNRITNNNGDGILISSGAMHNIIGGNLISGNSGDGVEISQANQNGIDGNFIGVDYYGLTAWPNGGNGVNINSGAISNTVMAPWDGTSVISGNALAGVRIEGNSTQGNIVNNVFIGASSDGDTLIANKDGVIISNAPKNDITNNIIVGNSRDGVAITGGGAQGNLIADNAIGTNAHLASLGNARYGVLLDAESSSNTLLQNKILYNGYFGDYSRHGGVVIQSSSGENILHRNTIAHNAGDGVLVTGASTAENRLDQNFIYSNVLEGINLESGANNNLAAPYFKSYIIRDSGVSLEATANGCPGCLFQVFSDGGGEGRYYEGSGTVSSNGKIEWKGTPQGSTYTLTVIDPYGNTSEFSAAPVFLDLQIDDALPHVTVNKLIGDAAGTAGKTIIEVAARITGYDASLTTNFTLTLTIPGNVLGAPTRVFYRDDIADLDGTAITSYTNPSSGVYELGGIDLNTVVTFPGNSPAIYSYERLVVFRFAMPETMSANSQLIPTATLSAGARAIARSYDWARINAAKKVDGIVITNRSLLYYNNYHGIESNDEDDATKKLLQTVFTMAQGAPYYNAAPVLAVYYVDQYSTTALNWDNTNVSYSSETTANTVANLLDSMSNDWFEDSTTKYSYYLCFGGATMDAVPANLDFTVVIVGDDDVIPYYRSHDPVYDPLYTTESDASGTEDLHDSLLRSMAAANYFFTDNPYADLYRGNCTYTRSWQEGGVEAYIGRIVGASSADMEKLIKSGLAGPQLSKTNGAIVASYDGFDADHIEGYMNSYPLNVFSSPLVDENDWRLSDLLSYMSGTASGATSWLAFAHEGHSNNEAWCTPADDDECHGLGGSALNTGNILTNITNMHPVVTSGGCRSGMSLATSATGSTIYGWVHAGASSIMASTGIAYGSTTEGIYFYGEVLHQQYWNNILLLKKYMVSTGFALQLDKSKWNNNGSWDGFEEKTIREFTIFGLPWVGFYKPATAPRYGLANLREALPAAELTWPVSAPAAVSASTYVVTATVDASEYTINQVNGFDLVNVQGMRLHYSDSEPVVPIAELTMPLPLGAVVQEVQVTPLDALSLGALQIPLVSPGLPMPGGPDDTYRETPASFGIYPSQLYSATVTTAAGSQLAQLTIFPLVYNADTDQATLYQHLVVRITYWVPTPVGLLGFTGEPANAAVGDPLHINSTLLNASDQVVEVSGVLTLTNSLGEAAAHYSIPDFAIPAGSLEYFLELDWTPGVPEGSYTLELEVWRDADAHMHAQQAVAFVAGRLSGLQATPLVLPFDPALFEVTFENLSSLAFNGQVHYVITTAGGLRVAELDVPFSVAPHAPITLVTPWSASALSPGLYTVTAVVTDLSGMTTYGPLQQDFMVAYSLFMPMVKR